jgi:hypothetical protein
MKETWIVGSATAAAPLRTPDNRPMKRIFILLATSAASFLALLPVTADAQTPAVTTGPATNIAQTSATLNGYLNPPSLATSYYFEYGTTTSYGQQTAAQAPPAGVGTTRVQANVTGLSAGTTYHFELVAVIGVGPLAHTVKGGDQTFTTGPSSGGPGHGAGPGSVKLAGRTLEITKGKATVALWCLSSVACRGRFSIFGANHACLSGRAFSLGAAVVQPLKERLSRGCMQLLRRRRRHEIRAWLRATPSTGQPRLSSKVLLVPRIFLT